jgi:hypothetical protein
MKRKLERRWKEREKACAEADINGNSFLPPVEKLRNIEPNRTKRQKETKGQEKSHAKSF